jgi:hypothetical protein
MDNEATGELEMKEGTPVITLAAHHQIVAQERQQAVAEFAENVTGRINYAIERGQHYAGGVGSLAAIHKELGKILADLATLDQPQEGE